MTRMTPAVIVVGLLNCVANATAQEARTYVGGGFIVVPWGGAHSVNAGTPSTTYTNTGPEAVNVGFLAEAGWFVNRTLAVGLEVGFPFQRNPVTQEYGYFNPFRRIGRYREITVFGVARARTPPVGRVRLAAVGGGGLVLGDLLKRAALGSFSRPGVFEPFGEEERKTLSGLAATFGGDLEAEVTSHIQIVPQFRLSVVDRGSLIGRNSEMAALGFNRLVYRSAVAVRAIF